MKKKVLISLLGPKLDIGTNPTRWEKWRPSVAICQQENFMIDRYELLYQENFQLLASIVQQDITDISPLTKIQPHIITIKDPWDFEEVYATLYDFAINYTFSENEEYFVHITTGTHVAQICLFLLTESRHFPAKLLQTSPSRSRQSDTIGSYTIIDLDLSKYNLLANRFLTEKRESYDLLKSGIPTKDLKFNQLIEKIEKVALRSSSPILLTGPTGAGKSQLARKIFELKKQKHQLLGNFIEINCATLRGDTAMSTLFGHKKGAYTGAQNDRPGLLMEAHQGILFLDEIGELGLDEQAMLLRALEDKTFLPVGSDKSASSHFQLICGTNKNLYNASLNGSFRPDLLARINVWNFQLPGLKDRISDLEPNINYELQKLCSENKKMVKFTTEAKNAYLQFATSENASWNSNFRDLNSSILRLYTLCDTERIDTELVEHEIEILKNTWQQQSPSSENSSYPTTILEDYLSAENLAEIDPFDKPQLAYVLEICQNSRSLSEAGRKLFEVSRKNKKIANDADRLVKYLSRFNLKWQDLK